MGVRNTIIHYVKSVTAFYVLVGISAGYSLVLDYDDKFLIYILLFNVVFIVVIYFLKNFGKFSSTVFPTKGFLIHSPSRQNIVYIKEAI